MKTDLTGAELDAEIARVVFGQTALHGAGGLWILGDPGFYCPRYSESLDDTWKVVHEMRKRGFDFALSVAGKDLWFCSFAQPPAHPSSSARAEIVTWAICWAALKAIDNPPVSAGHTGVAWIPSRRTSE